MHQAPLERKRLVPFRQCSARSRTSARTSISPSSDGRLAHGDGAGAERLDGEAVARKLVGARNQTLDVDLVELDDLGDQQDLARDAGRASAAFSRS